MRRRMALRRPGGRGRLVLFGGSGSQSCPFRSIWRRRAASLQEGAARQNHESVPMASSPPHYEQQYLDLMRHIRSEEHTSELQSLMRISYAVFCLKKNKIKITNKNIKKNKLNKEMMKNKI